MRRALWLSAIALVIAMTAGWLRLAGGGRAIDPAATAGAERVVAATVGSVDARPASAISLDPEPGPNSATAEWLTDLQRPGRKPPSLPYPIDASLDRDAARALYRKSREISDCYMAQSSAVTREWEQWTGTAWLEAAERDRVLAALRAALQRQLGNCRRHGLREDGDGAAPGDPIPPGFVLWARLSAAASGEPAARAHHFRSVNRRVDVAAEIRPILRELLVAAPSDLPNAGWLQSRYGQELGPLLRLPAAGYGQLRNALPDTEALWLLVACDMGMDCAGTSVEADRWCVSRGLCGYPDLESAVRDGLLGSAELAPTLLARQQIVAALRRGDLAALVEPGSTATALPRSLRRAE